MNSTIHQLTHRYSSRSFTDQPIAKEALDAIVASAYQAPTSLNSQQVSLIITKDPARRAKIAEYSGDQAWVAKAPIFITVVIDLYKTDVALMALGKKLVIPETVEGIITGCTDVGITLATLMTAAQSLGLGAVAIGGIRLNLPAMIELLDLPKYTLPIVGVALGHIDQPATIKPRLALSSFCHEEHYQRATLPKAIDDYDQRLTHYWQEINRSDGLSWSENMAKFYTYDYCPEEAAVLYQQGFTLGK